MPGVLRAAEIRTRASVELGPMLGVASVRANSFDEASGEFEIVVSTGLRRRVTSYFQDAYWEQLDMSPQAVMLERLNAGAPILNSHGRTENRGGAIPLEHQLGVVVRGSARVENGQLVCRGKLSNRESVAWVRQDLKDGILGTVSFGYWAHEFRNDTEPGATEATFTAIKWEPFEVTLTPVPADHMAGVRSATEETRPCRIEPAHRNMNEKLIRSLVRSAGLPESLAEELIRAGANDEAVTARIEQEVATRNAAAGSGGGAPAGSAPAPAAAGTRAANANGAGAPAGTATAVAEPQPAAGVRALASPNAAFSLADIAALQRSALGAGLTPEQFQEVLVGSSPHGVEHARSALLERMAARQDRTMPHGTGAAVGLDERDKVRSAVENALLNRVGWIEPERMARGERTPIALSDAGREFRGFTLSRLAEECVRAAGERVRGRSRDEVILRAMSSSDFPLITSNVAGRSMRMAYDLQRRTFTAISRRVSVPDFKTQTRVQLDVAPDLKKVLEDGEITLGKVGESAETYALATYARRLVLTRKLIINDDMQALDRLPRSMGARAAQLENVLAWLVLTSNAGAGQTMSDAVALFHANHNNLITGGGSALSEAALQAALAKFRLQKALDGSTLINVQPAHLIVPAALEVTAKKLTAQVAPNTTTGVNVFANFFNSVIVEPLLDGVSTTAWFLAADPAAIDVLEHAYLEGRDGPQVETIPGRGVDGVEMQVVHDFAVAAIEYRALQKNAGA